MKRILSLSLVLMMVLSLFAFAPLTVSAATGGADASNPLLIGQTEIDSYAGATLNGYFKLKEPVTIKAPIYWLQSGGFDGDGFTVDLQIDNPDGSRGTGMFVLIGNTDKTVDVTNVNFTGSVNGSKKTNGTGALAGEIYAGQVNISNVTSSATVTNTYAAGDAIGGIIGKIIQAYVQEANFTDCKNYGVIGNGTNTYAGGIMGMIGGSNFGLNYPTKVVLDKCYNYGTVKPLYYGSAFGYVILQLDSKGNPSVEIKNSGNEGLISGGYVAGLVYDVSTKGNISVSKCYNVGVIDCTGNRVNCVLLVWSLNKLAVVTDSFNAGKANATYADGTKPEKGYLVSGASVKNCYNVTKNLGALGRDSAVFENCYTIEGTALSATEKADSNIKAVSEETLKASAASIGTSFEKATPTKTSAYPYPQIVGNEYVVAAATIPATLGTIGGGFSANEDISGTYADGEISYTGAYVAGFGIAQDLFGWEKTYGMILTDANGVEYEADAVANSATKSGNYGVLFYGSKLVPGEYTLTPYVTYTNYGETYQVKGETQPVTIAE